MKLLFKTETRVLLYIYREAMNSSLIHPVLIFSVRPLLYVKFSSQTKKHYFSLWDATSKAETILIDFFVLTET